MQKQSNLPCAPGAWDSSNDTCYRTRQLVELAGAYNRYIAKGQLRPEPDSMLVNATLINIKPDKLYLLNEFRQRFNQVCGNNESCWLRSDFINEIVGEIRTDITESFRPMGPEVANEWLSTTDIDNILKQYEKVYPRFKFYGAVPLDCDVLSFCELYNLDFEKERQAGIEQIGIVYNHDKHNKSGSHWVAMFIDIPSAEINYCDSTGRKPFGNIVKMIDNFTRYCHNRKMRPIYLYNANRYQTDDTECGIYSCNFIIRRLSGEGFDNVVQNPLDFKGINSCRNVYFRNNPSNHPSHHLCDPARHQYQYQ